MASSRSADIGGAAGATGPSGWASGAASVKMQPFMPLDPSFFASVFFGYLAIMNPIANIPIFLALTAGEPDASVRRAIAVRSVLVAFGIVAAFAFAGPSLLQLFGITLPAFRITGGVLVALIGYQMLHGGPSKVQGHEPGADSKAAELGAAISPLAMPILAGPGTIATTMNFAHGDVGRKVGTVAVFAVMCLITCALFLSGERIVRYLGQSAMAAVTRLMGMILAVIGVQMLVAGVQAVLHS